MLCGFTLTLPITAALYKVECAPTVQQETHRLLSVV